MTSSARPANRRILVIDDDAEIHRDFGKILGAKAEQAAADALSVAEARVLGDAPKIRTTRSFEVDSAYQGVEGVRYAGQALRDGRPYAVAFVDLCIPPGWNGVKTIEQLWKADPDLQVVICSAQTDCGWLEVVSRLGHSDKLLVLRKPFEPIEVLQCAAALSRKWENQRIVRDQLERLEQVLSIRTRGLDSADRQLRHLVTHDVLTGLPNRALLEDRLTQAMAHASRHWGSIALLVCDIDRFKIINESLGRRAGDQLLQEVAKRLTSLVSSVDTVARFGGNEFVLLVTSAEPFEDVENVASRVIDALKAPFHIAGIDVRVSPTVGIACYPTDGVSTEALIAHADIAVARAKQRGQGNVQRFERGMMAGTEARVQLESDLHDAIELNQFELHYQPKVDTMTATVRSAEALIRWAHPRRGLVAPAEFIPLAEECRLIGAIGEWVMREACRQARAWQDDGLVLPVAVNLSASQFRHRGLVDTIRRALKDARLEPRYLEMELTESAVMSDAEQSIAILEQLNLMGVRCSIDDFGTGYSSMSYLRRLPIDKLKIDRVFISDVVKRSEDASIVRAIVSLAHTLHLKVVAEGVETSAQLEFLKEVGCDEYQGYHFSQALSAPDFERLMRKLCMYDLRGGDEDATHADSGMQVHRPRGLHLRACNDTGGTKVQKKP